MSKVFRGKRFAYSEVQDLETPTDAHGDALRPDPSPWAPVAGISKNFSILNSL